MATGVLSCDCALAIARGILFIMSLTSDSVSYIDGMSPFFSSNTFYVCISGSFLEENIKPTIVG